MKRSIVAACAASALALGVLAEAGAQDAAYPNKPVKLLIGFPPGSVQDLSARAISEQLSKTLGQPVIVENKAGASGTIAADQVSKSTDLHTFGVMNNSQPKRRANRLAVVLWVVVGAALIYGISQTVIKTSQLFS